MNSMTKGVVWTPPFGEHHYKFRGVEEGRIYAVLDAEKQNLVRPTSLLVLKVSLNLQPFIHSDHSYI